MKCIHCGADLNDENAKCEYCGLTQNNSKKKKSKLVLIIVCIILIVAIVIGLFILLGNKEKKEEFTGEQKEVYDKVINYVKDKYSFTPEVLSIDEDTTYGGLGIHKKNGNHVSECSYNNKKFIVYVEKETIVDNYQKDEIENDVKKAFEELTKGKVLDVSLKYGESYNEYQKNGLINIFYEKNKLQDLLSCKIDYICPKVSIELVDASDLSVIEKDSFAGAIPDLAVVNYKSESDYEIVKDHFYQDYFDIEQNGIYLKNAYLRKIYDIQYYDFDMKSYDDIYLYNNGLSTEEEITLSKTDTPDVKKWIGRGCGDNVKAVSDAYKVENITSNRGHLYLYIPKNKLSDTNNVKIGVQCGDSNHVESTEIVGDYVTGFVTVNACKSYDDVIIVLLKS